MQFKNFKNVEIMEHPLIKHKITMLRDEKTGTTEFRNLVEEIAMLEGYDIHISGDTPHHIRRDVIASHYNYLDVSHEVEKIFMKQMDKLLKEIDPKLETIIIDHEALPELITK